MWCFEFWTGNRLDPQQLQARARLDSHLFCRRSASLISGRRKTRRAGSPSRSLRISLRLCHNPATSIPNNAKGHSIACRNSTNENREKWVQTSRNDKTWEPPAKAVRIGGLRFPVNATRLNPLSKIPLNLVRSSAEQP